MAERDRAAIDVELAFVEAELLADGQRLSSTAFLSGPLRRIMSSTAQTSYLLCQVITSLF
jgi:hypothetical protein